MKKLLLLVSLVLLFLPVISKEKKTVPDSFFINKDFITHINNFLLKYKGSEMDVNCPFLLGYYTVDENNKEYFEVSYFSYPDLEWISTNRSYTYIDGGIYKGKILFLEIYSDLASIIDNQQIFINIFKKYKKKEFYKKMSLRPIPRGVRAKGFRNYMSIYLDEKKNITEVKYTDENNLVLKPYPPYPINTNNDTLQIKGKIFTF